MNKRLKQVIILIGLIAILILPYFVFAADTAPLDALKGVAEGGGYSSESAGDTFFASTIGTIITAALSLVGVIFLVLTIYGGFLWMTASGKEEQVTKAKNILTMALIGLIIVLSAYAITRFVYSYLIEKTPTLQ